MAQGASFDQVGEATAFARELGAPLVVKADGLAAGKGVTVCGTVAQAEAAIRDAMEGGVFGDAGRRVVVERRLSGREASIMAICDGTTAVGLPPARDHKRIGDADTGPNTGGMGAYSPLADLPDGDSDELVERFHRPALAEMARRGTPFRGLLYAGLMLTADGPRLLEFNVRFGDPEAQAVLPRVDGPLAALLLAAANGELRSAGGSGSPGAGGAAVGGTWPIAGAPGATVAVVLAAAGYPSTPRTGDPIDGLAAARAAGALIFHAATAIRHGWPVTAGGRVLTVVGRGRDTAAAREQAYTAADLIRFRGLHRRSDIGVHMAELAGVPA